jgi:DeoR family glycerol-3-phosphate regulon repressor
MIVTNNLNVANILAVQPGCAVTVTGGSLRRADGGLVGPLAAETLRAFKFDLAVIGCSALDAEGDLLDYDIQEVAVSQSVLRQSRQTILVADQSKLRRSAPVRIASLAQLDAVITDAPLPAPLAEACAGWETEVIIAPAE